MESGVAERTTDGCSAVARTGSSCACLGWATWLAAGLVIGGVGLGVWSLTRSVRPIDPGWPEEVGVGVGWCGGALVALAAIYLLVALAPCRAASRGAPPERRRGGRRVPAPPGPGHVVCRLAALVAAVVIGALALRPAISLVDHHIDSGIPRAATPMLAGALVMVLAGVVTLIAAPPVRPVGSRADGEGPRSRRRTGRARAGVAVAVVCVPTVCVALVVVMARSIEAGAVDSTTAPPPSGDGTSPAGSLSPTRVLWTRPPAEGDVFVRPTVHAAGDGVLVAGTDGVTALDGRTGDERWHYRRPGASLQAVTTSPDGRWVLATFVPSGSSRWTSLRVSLDGRTGEVAFETGDPHRGVHDADGVSDHTFVSVIGDPADDEVEGVDGFDPTDGHRVWTWDRPADCPSPFSETTLFADAGAATIVVMMTCIDPATWERGAPVDGQFRFVGLDDRTGHVRWTVDQPFEDVALSMPSATVDLSPSGTFAALSSTVAAESPEFQTHVVETSSGEVVGSTAGSAHDRWVSDDGLMFEDAFREPLQVPGAPSLAGTNLEDVCATGVEQADIVVTAAALVDICHADGHTSAIVVSLDGGTTTVVPFEMPDPDGWFDPHVVWRPSALIVENAQGIVALG